MKMARLKCSLFHMIAKPSICAKSNMISSCLSTISRFFFTGLVLSSTCLFITCNSDFKILLDDKNNVLMWALASSQARSSTIFWTELGGAIRQIFPDGTGESTVLNLTDGPFLDLVVYTPGSKVFWAMYSTSVTAFQIRSAGIDGSGQMLAYQPPPASTKGPSAVQIDSANAMIYWDEYQGGPSFICRSALDSITRFGWVQENTEPYTYGIAIDSLNGRVYFTKNSYWDVSIPGPLGVSNTGHIYVYEIGTGSAFVPSVPGTGQAGNSVPLRGIAVDGAGGHTYYARHINTDSNAVIVRADLSLGSPVVWIDPATVPLVCEIKKLALDLRGRKIYWTSDTLEIDGKYSIYRADLDTQSSNIERFLPLAGKPTGIAVTP